MSKTPLRAVRCSPELDERLMSFSWKHAILLHQPKVMKGLFRSFALLSAVATSAILQTATAQFEQGDNVLGVGVGIGGGYNIGFSGSGVSQSPAIGLHLDHGMGDLGPGTWGLGGFVGYKSISYNYDYPGWNFAYDYKYTYLTIGARGTWHYNEWHGLPNLDTYGGIMLAYRSVSFKNNTVYPSNWIGGRYEWNGSGVGFSGILGARYYFTDNIGAFMEAGFGYSTLQLGLAAKF